MIQKLSIYPLNARLMYNWKVADALVSPNSITRYSQWPYLVQNAIFHSSLSLIRIRQQAFRKSILLKILLPYRRSSSSPISGNGQRFLTMASFKPLQSTQRHKVLSFFGTNSIGALARLTDSQMILRFNISMIYSSNIAYSADENW